MIRKFIITVSLSLLLLPGHGRSQTIPAEGSFLNYRLVGFKVPSKKGVALYEIEIASGTVYTEDSFKAHFIKKAQSDKNTIVTDVPSFGASYTWRVVYPGLAQPAGSALLHFSTLDNPQVNPDLFRLKVTTKASTFPDAFVFVDANKTLYDMTGKPVWFLPPIEGNNLNPRDLKLTPFGTITFVSDNNAYEINYDGKILWKAPNGPGADGEPKEHFHHEITRLSNGHYIVLGSEPMLIKRTSVFDTMLHYVPFDKKLLSMVPVTYLPAMLVEVKEYNRAGKLLWSWKGSDHFKGSLARFYPHLYDMKGGAELDFHANALYYDEHKKNLYLSLRNVNTILKIRYPSGKIINEYRGYPDSHGEDDLFCSQHGCGISSHGQLFTFNNNDCHPSAGPGVVMMSEPENEGGTLKKTWEFNCPYEKLPSNHQTKLKSTSGGNVVELPDGTWLVTLSSLEARSIIVGPNKNILWSATAEMWNAEIGAWIPSDNSYRSSIILNRNDIEHLIFGQPGK